MKLSEMSNIEDDKEKTKNITEKYEELKKCSSDELFNRLSKKIRASFINITVFYFIQIVHI